MINIIIWLLSGSLIGWVASAIMRAAPQGMVINVAVGIFGAAIGGGVISPMVGIPSLHASAFNGGAFIVALIGAVTLLGLFNLLRPSTVR